MVATITRQSTYSIVCPTLPDAGEIIGDIRAVFESGRVTVGENVAALEGDNCAHSGVRHTIAVSSGTSGLILLLRALNLPRGSEVITPSFTFAATSHALIWNGLKTVFCDSEPDSFTMDVSKAEALINENTSAIYPVCIFGVPGDLDAYEKLASKYGLALLFDSAQGLGSTYKGTGLGNFGNGEVFSLSPTKVITAMEGGLVTTNDDELARVIRQMRDYGKAPDGEDMGWLGLSARMPEINAIVARWSLARMDEWVARRISIMDSYRSWLGDLPGVSFQKIPDYCTSTRNYFVMLLNPDMCPVSRDELYHALKIKGVQTKRYFYPALHNQTLYKDTDPECRARLPVAERIAARSLALPMYSHMSLDAVDDICERIMSCFTSATIRPAM
ncbi:MAG: DegT/DnrJ/EryC1/StrS family aminotransferase [Armatimonadota bacterium]|nr:DegT/DnrJ/EryC1/StrS family aminotransferase [bacterium]